MRVMNILFLFISFSLCIGVLIYVHRSDSIPLLYPEHKNAYLALRVTILIVIAVLTALGFSYSYKEQTQKALDSSNRSDQIYVDDYNCEATSTDVTRMGETILCDEWSGKTLATDEYLQWEADNYTESYAFMLPIIFVTLGAVMDGVLIPKKN